MAYEQNVWIRQYTDPKTGYDYIFQFYKPDADPLDWLDDGDSTDVITLNEGCFSKIEYDWEYEDYSFGMPKSPALKITFNMNVIGGQGLNKQLMYPFVTLTDTWTPTGYDAACLIPISLEASTICRLYIKFNGQETSPTWRLVFVGMQKNGIEDGYKSKTNTFEAEFYDIGRCITESVKMSWLKYFYFKSTNPLKNAKEIYDWIYYISTDHYRANWLAPAFLTLYEEMAYFWMVKYSDFWDYLELLSSQIATLLLRETKTITIEEPDATYLKQSYQNEGTPGASLTHSDIYFPGYVTIHSSASRLTTPTDEYAFNYTVLGGVFKNDLSEDFASLWDFLSDAFKEGFNRYWFNPNTMTFQRIRFYQTKGHAISRYSETNPFSGIEIIPGASALKRSQVAAVETVDKDISCFETVKDSSRSENTLNIPVIFNNVPTAIARQRISTVGEANDNTILDRFTFNYGSVDFKLRLGYQGHLRELCYIDDPKDGNGTSMTRKDLIINPDVDIFIRCNEYCTYYLGNSIYSYNVYPFASEAFMDFTSIPVNNEPNDINEAVYLQNHSGKQYILSKVMDGMFGNTTSKLKGKTILKSCTNLSDSDLLCFWFNPVGYLSLTLSEFAPANETDLFTGLPTPTQFYPKSCKVDLIEGSVEFEGLGV
jgi:hypothetical protein